MNVAIIYRRAIKKANCSKAADKLVKLEQTEVLYLVKRKENDEDSINISGSVVILLVVA